MKTKSYILSAFIFLMAFSAFARPKVALVLSGGGAKGLAEIPLIEALEEEGIRPDVITGTSMGSLIGSLYAAGYTPKQIRQTMKSLDFMAILNEAPTCLEQVFPLAFSTNTDNHGSLAFTMKGVGGAPGIIGDQKILMELNNHLSKVMTITDFDKLPIPYRAVVTDVSSGEQIYYSSGSIVGAVRASMSLPGIFTPAPVDDGSGRYAMDGGLRNNIPIELAKNLGAEIVIAMDVASIVDTDPKTLSSYSAVAVQIFNLIISNNAVEQYPLADIVLRPDLTGFNTLDFIHSDGIINAGQICVDQNREEIHKLALKIESMGFELQKYDYDRESVYDKFPELKIESVEIRDISIVDPIPLPQEKNFAKYVGRKFDDETKVLLANDLDYYRDKFNLSSFAYYLKPGSTEGKCVLELQANHYKQNPSKVFVGGTTSITVQKDPDSDPRFIPVPDVTVGTYLDGKRVDMLSRLALGNVNFFDLWIMPQLFTVNHFKSNLDFGAGVKYGSLEPMSAIYYDNRTAARDLGAEAHAGIIFRYSDMVTLRGGIDYEISRINSDFNYYNVLSGYAEFIFTTIHNDPLAFRGIQCEAQIRAGEYNDGNPIYSQRFLLKQKIPLKRNFTSIGYELQLANMHFPYELNSGYADYGGLNGMCGYARGEFHRDMAIVGVTFQQRVFSVASMPLTLLLDVKAGIHDEYDPYCGKLPNSSYFDGFDGFGDVEYGAGLYVGFKTSMTSFVIGASVNSEKMWTFSLNLM